MPPPNLEFLSFSIGDISCIATIEANIFYKNAYKLIQNTTESLGYHNYDAKELGKFCPIPSQLEYLVKSLDRTFALPVGIRLSA